jgi:hypothetical protein
VDGQFGIDTLEAVWAFQEVQGLPAQDAVTPAMQQALADPRPPVVLVPGGGSTRIEINLVDEVLVLYRADRVALINHVSTGGGYYYCSPGGGCGYAVTPTGDFSTTAFMPGWVTVPLGQTYNPGVLHRHRVCHPRRYGRAGAAGLAWLRVDPGGHRRVLLHAGPDAGHAGIHPLTTRSVQQPVAAGARWFAAGQSPGGRAGSRGISQVSALTTVLVMPPSPG